MTRIPNDLEQLLNQSGLAWELRSGGRHHKLIVGGKLATVLPLSSPRRQQPGRAHQNILARVRQVIRGEKGARDG